MSEIPISYVWMGSLSDPSMIAKLYAAADVTVVASLYETFWPDYYRRDGLWLSGGEFLIIADRLIL